MNPRDVPVQFLKGVGPRRAEQLARIGLLTVGDLLHHLPARYLDRRQATPLGRLEAGTTAVVQGTIARVKAVRTAYRRVRVVEAALTEGGARATLVWFGRGYLAKELEAGQRLMAVGRVEEGRRVLVEEHEILEEGRDPVHASGLVPAYPATEGLGKRAMRTLIRQALETSAPSFQETLPEDVLRARDLPPLAEALRAVHAPSTPEEAERGRRRLAYEELLLRQVRMALDRRRRRAVEADVALPVGKGLDFRIRQRFPFAFTTAQERAIRELRRDLAGGPPMHRLLQGDVGSGKTAVAAYAMLAAVGNKAQAALMAPTEILAEQHARTLGRLLEGSKVRIGLLSGSLPARARAELLARVAAGEVDLLVGTHALIEGDVRFRALGLVVIDEQQKFGVVQRARLGAKGARPHVLVMTATPIPRTLALALYGDLDVTVLDELPPGRGPVTTLHAPSEGRREKLGFVRRKLDEGRQAYFIYPLVDDSDVLELRSAVRMYDELSRDLAPHAVALLHGRMTAEQKEAAVAAFRDGRARVLVSTLVVEVGIDVPNASVMVIDHAERFGLAQLHQLRGRIGRGPHPSVCIALGRRNDRIDAFVSTTDGFRLAEADLRLRGPGEPEGARQSGLLFFRAARLPDDAALLEAAREDATALVEADPELAAHPDLRRALEAGPANLLHVG